MLVKIAAFRTDVAIDQIECRSINDFQISISAELIFNSKELVCF